MKVTQLSERFSVSDQVHPEDIDTLAQAGVEILICNRPDSAYRRAHDRDLHPVHLQNIFRKG